MVAGDMWFAAFSHMLHEVMLELGFPEVCHVFSAASLLLFSFFDTSGTVESTLSIVSLNSSIYVLFLFIVFFFVGCNFQPLYVAFEFSTSWEKGDTMIGIVKIVKISLAKLQLWPFPQLTRA